MEKEENFLTELRMGAGLMEQFLHKAVDMMDAEHLDMS